MAASIRAIPASPGWPLNITPEGIVGRPCGVSAPVPLPEAAPVGTVGLVTDLPPPSRTARVVVGVLAALTLLTGTFVLAQVAFIARYLGAPTWGVAAGVAVVLICLAAAFRRVRRAAARR